MFDNVQFFVVHVLEWLRLLIETTGAVILAWGFVRAFGQLLQTGVIAGKGDFRGPRRTLAQYLALALEFQLAADILSTAIAPTWDEIGKLAVIAVLRTGLNYFLELEMRREAEPVPQPAVGE